MRVITTGQIGAAKLLDFYKKGVPIKYEKDKTVKFTSLFDYENIWNNEFLISRQVSNNGNNPIRNDILLYVNGIPIVSIELKDPTNPAESWVTAYNQINDYKKSVPELYKYIQIGVGANSEARYFPIVDWSDEVRTEEWKHDELGSIDAVIKMLTPSTLLDIIGNFLFVRIEKSEATKVLPRYMQLRAVNKIVDRVKDNYCGKDDKNKGLIWHWQGSGKTFEIISAAEKLKGLSILENPTIFILLDRDDLQTQLSGEYYALDIKSTQVIENIYTLKKIIGADSFNGMRGVFIVLMQKFRPEELSGLIEELSKRTNSISTRRNVVCLIDEGHRSQHGLLAAQMKQILKSAFFFAFTGTPIARLGKNTYLDFSYPPKEKQLDKYFIIESITDGFTKRIVKKSRLDELHLSKEALEEFFDAMAEEIPAENREDLKEDIRQKLNRINVFLEDPTRIKAIAEDIAKHFKENVEGQYKAMIVTASRKACAIYKEALDQFLPPSYSEVIMTYDPKKDAQEPVIQNYIQGVIKKNHGMDYEQIRKQAIENYKEEEYPKILIVTDMLLTGFDAPILQTMYLDKLMKDQRLLQAIARTNRPYKEKEAGLIIDYVGLFDRIEKAFAIYEKDDIASAVLNTAALITEFTETIDKLISLFVGVDRDYKITTLQRTIEIITSDKLIEESFVKYSKHLKKLYEFLGSSEEKLLHLEAYKWLTAIYVYYIKVVIRDEDYQQLLKKYFKKTLQLIHSQTEVKELIESPTFTVIDEAFIKGISDKGKDKKAQTSNLVFALNKFVLVDQHKNPIYESLIDRVDKLVKEWKERIKNLQDTSPQSMEAESLAVEILEVQSKQKQLGLSDYQMAIWLSMKTSLGFDSDESVLSELKKLFDELKPAMIPGWSHNIEMKKIVETKLREFLFVNVRPKYPMPLEKINSIHKDISDKMVHYGS
ncbi:MAG: HsdR family type I site-specific deoxyribonuclease, partial [Ignavibacteriaceae bacterium]|nr:HsdR family type I site-specific deoxyribonuclease [Ignavibacteriaceae bacterium]